MILGNPPQQTPATDRGFFTQPWSAWFSNIKTMYDALTKTAGGALQSSNNLSDLASSPAALANLIGAWQNWTPAVTADPGMTVSSLVITAAEFLLLGPLVMFTFNVGFTLSGTAVTRLLVTLPTVPVDNQSTFAIFAAGSSANQSLTGRSDTVNGALIRPTPSAVWTLGNQQFMASGFYRRS